MSHWWDRWTGSGPPLPADERRRRRREAIIIAATAIVFLIFAILQTRLPRVTNSSSLSGNITFFLLINLNVILLVLLVFLVVRNLVKLVFERRRGIFGSRLRTRLVLAFVALTLFPGTLLFVVVEGFLTAAFESWFNVRVENALSGAKSVAESYYQFAANNALHFADEIGRQAEARNLLSAAHRTELQRLAQEQRAAFNVAAIEIFAADRASLARVLGPEFSKQPPAEGVDTLAELFSGQDVTRTRRYGKGDIVRAGVPVRGGGGQIVGAVVVDYLVPRHVSSPARDIAQGYEEYRQITGMKQPIKGSYMLTLVLITLVVLFSATWFGFQQAKSITIPLQRLAAGTREVAQGNWGHRIEAGSDEETAVLVDSFNRMTGDLQTMHAELVERRKYVENILANSAAGVVSLDHRGRVTTLNPAAERMLGVRLAQAYGRPWSEVFVGSHLRDVGDAIGEALAAPQREFERQIKLTGGDHIVTALVTATGLADDAGTPRGLMLFFEDVTHLLRVQRMEAWREVARRLAHEIKNPLTPIQLSAQRLRKRYAADLGKRDGTVFDECTRTIIGQVDALKRLVNEFSTFARLPTAELTAQSLNAVVDEAIALYRQGHLDISFEFRPAQDLPLVDLDRDAFKRALINMLDNAVAACHAAESPGRIEVVTSHLAARGVARLEVADNGCGMSHEVKLRLFEPYFSTKKDGTGLGLAIVSAIVADHQGYIRVQDNQPRGSRFLIDFPLRGRGELGRVAARA